MMTDPDEANFAQSIKKARKLCTLAFDDCYVYPAHVRKEAKERKRPPKCIFIPNTNVLRKMIRALVNKKANESKESFLFRFSLSV